MKPHLNQPGGEFLPSAHPSVIGRERELRRLADAARRLIAASVDHLADPATTEGLAAEIEAVTAELLPHVPDPLHPRYAGTPPDGHPHDFFALDPVLGLYNPLALPVEVSWEPPVAVGRAVFGTPYEGPPGCLHGAVIAGVFDQVCNVANLNRRVAGPTKTLEVRYRRPTLLGEECRFEARVHAVEGREVTTHAVLLQGGKVTCEGVLVFVSMSAPRR